MEWSIRQLAKAAGTTSRTLRHYDDVGLLAPSRTAAGGMRMYDESALPRLLRILMLRELGVGLPAIGAILTEQVDDVAALRGHLDGLRQQRTRLEAQISSVEDTINKLEGGETLMAEEVFKEFDHTQYREEVEERWGKKAYADSDRWWRSLSDGEKRDFQQRQHDIAADYGKLAEAGVPADGDEAQAVTRRHVEWLSGPVTPTREYLIGLGEMYVADPRFGANYPGYAEFVRDAMTAYAEQNL